MAKIDIHWTQVRLYFSLDSTTLSFWLSPKANPFQYADPVYSTNTPEYNDCTPETLQGNVNTVRFKPWDNKLCFNQFILNLRKRYAISVFHRGKAKLVSRSAARINNRCNWQHCASIPNLDQLNLTVTFPISISCSLPVCRTAVL